MGGVEVILVDEKEASDAKEIVATSDHIYLCRDIKNPCLSIQDKCILWNDKWDKKTLLDIRGENVGSAIKLDDYLFFSKSDQGICRLKGLTNLVEKEMEELTNEYCQVFNIGTDGRFLYLDSDTPRTEKVILINSEFEVMKTFESSVSQIFSGTEFFYRLSKDSSKNTFEKFRDGVLLTYFDFNVCDSMDGLFESCSRANGGEDLARLIGEKEYVIHPFTDGSELYTLTTKGDIWHISNKSELIYSSNNYAANKGANATNGKYGILFEDKKVLAFSKGSLVGEYDSPINSEDIVDVLLDQKIQRYRILD
jgi:hypothetical protein